MIQRIRGIVQMNDTVAVRAQNGEILHTRCGGFFYLRQWQQMVNLAVVADSTAVDATKREPAYLAVE